MFASTPPITRNLVILNALFFLAKLLVASQGIYLDYVLGSFFPASPNFHLYQILTHMFMHGDWMHILFNMIALWSFGSAIEQTLGQKKYLTLYFVCGIGAYILFNVWNYFQVQEVLQRLHEQGADIARIYRNAAIDMHGRAANPQEWGPEVGGNPQDVMQLLSYLQTPMVGASGAIYGLLVAFAMMYPNARIMLLFPPIPIKAKILMPILIFVELYLGMNNYQGDNIAHIAHLGGAVIAFFMIRHWTKNRFRIDR